MTQHSGKSSDFIEVKTNLQMCILRIILFIKTAVSSNDCLDPGPQAIAGLRHGVPVEGPHHLLYLLDQILGFVAILCIGPQFRFATLRKIKISKSVALRRAGRPDLLLLHLPKVPLEPFLHPFAVVDRGAVLLEDVMVISRYPSVSFDTILSNLFWNFHLLHPGGTCRGPW
jgi:hypothetical protein